ARGCDRRGGPIPDRTRVQGVAEGRATGRPHRAGGAGRPGPGAPARPRPGRRPHARLRAARGRAGLQHGARRRGHAGSRHPAGHDDHPLLLVVAADHADGAARHPGRRGRRLHLRRRGDGVPVRQGQLRLPARHPQPGVLRRPGPHAARRAGRRGLLERPAGGRAPPRRLHRDGADRRERRAAQGRHARGHGPLRRALAEPRREGHRQRLLRPRDHPGDAAGRHRGLHRRRPPRRHHLRGGVAAQAGVPPGRPDHRRQRLPAQRRCRRADRHVRREGRRAGRHPARAGRRHRRVRPVAGDHGPRPGGGDQAGAGPRRHDHRRRRPRRAQRGVRRAGPPQRPRPGHRRGQAQRPRRRHRAGPPLRHDRRADHHHSAQRPARHRRHHRAGDDVRRRRAGHGPGARAPGL
ncbi:MAG: 3-ketoacyl-CoA thiolase @ Acetyl-CoA acetyltransferase, partial [uncultured Pseudonocardia sp.]